MPTLNDVYTTAMFTLRDDPNPVGCTSSPDCSLNPETLAADFLRESDGDIISALAAPYSRDPDNFGFDCSADGADDLVVVQAGFYDSADIDVFLLSIEDSELNDRVIESINNDQCELLDGQCDSIGIEYLGSCYTIPKQIADGRFRNEFNEYDVDG